MNISEAITYAITFLAVYVQLFLLVTFLQKRGQLAKENTRPITLKRYPTVAVMVPCWNEEKTVHKTVETLLALDYPKDKLEIVVVDDGSTDNTWNEMKKYEGHPQIKIFQKENGGKHTAVNFGIDRTTSEFISCLDADSFVAPDALKRILNTFEHSPDVMAVAPSIIIDKPKNFLQAIQRIEYNMALYIKKMLSYLNAIHVTPGPFSVFKREVFEKIGKFRKAHNTEDAEIAFRMQVNHMKIEHCHLAHVYTVAPDTIRKLFRQRLRWIYGFIQNAKDYRFAIFKKKYGNFALFTLPSGTISIVTIIYIFSMLLYHLGKVVVEKIVQIQTVGFEAAFRFTFSGFDPFFVNTKTTMLVYAALYTFVAIAIVQGQRMAKEKRIFSGYLIPYMIVYSLLTPLWLIKAVWNSIVGQKPKWR